MKKLFAAIIIAAAVYVGYARYNSPATSELAAQFGSEASNTQIHGSGVVTRILSDDDEGSRHQRFIIRLPSGQTLLVAHNIDLAPRVAAIQEGDTVEFSGEYEWNSKGGVVHWTHRDPSNAHVAGWLKHDGRVFQ